MISCWLLIHLSSSLLLDSSKYPAHFTTTIVFSICFPPPSAFQVTLLPPSTPYTLPTSNPSIAAYASPQSPTSSYHCLRLSSASPIPDHCLWFIAAFHLFVRLSMPPQHSNCCSLRITSCTKLNLNFYDVSDIFDAPYSRLLKCTVVHSWFQLKQQVVGMPMLVRTASTIVGPSKS